MSQRLTRRQLIGGAVAAGGLASWAVRAGARDLTGLLGEADW